MSHTYSARYWLLELRAQAFVFDNDGTLVDTESVWFEAYQRLLSRYGLVHDFVVHRQMMGQSPRACIETLQRAHPTLPQGEAGIDQLLPERRSLYQATRSAMGIHVLPGVEEFLRWARSYGILLAMATSATREDIAIQNGLLGWDELFPVIVTADDVTRHKPEPDVYLEAAHRLGVAPASCLAFEDGANGLRSARAAGMSTVFVRDVRFEMVAPFEPTLTTATFLELLENASLGA